MRYRKSQSNSLGIINDINYGKKMTPGNLFHAILLNNNNNCLEIMQDGPIFAGWILIGFL
jgi:hypothetical protein